MTKPATLAQISEHLFCSKQWVSELRKRGIVPKGCTLNQAREGYLSYLRNQPEAGNDSKADFAAERALLTREQRITQELKNSQLRREMAPIQIFEVVLAKLASQITSVVATLPGEIKRKLPHLTATEIAIVERAKSKMMNTVANLPVILDESITDSLEN